MNKSDLILSDLPRKLQARSGGRRRKPITYFVNENGCFICTSHCRDKHGYPLSNYRVGGKRFNTTLSRLVFEAFTGTMPIGLVIRHKCDEPSCINPEHLESGTHLDNAKDCIERGRRQRAAKLTVDQVREIRNSPHLTHQRAAEKFGVALATIRAVRSGLTWKHVAGGAE